MFVVAYLVVLVARPEWAALAPIGPNPYEGGRFYGTSNLTTTVLVTVALLVRGRRPALGVGAAALATVGWSKAGADGGGPSSSSSPAASPSARADGD